MVRSFRCGHRLLWIRCVGEGEPTVVLESGFGGDHQTWEQIVPQLAETTRVCTYDRAGIARERPGRRDTHRGRLRR